MTTVVITGVSTGIGYATAKQFISKGIKVFGSVRNHIDGEGLQNEFGHLFTPLYFDITNQQAVQQAATQVRIALHGETLACLVNNAGIIVPAPLIHQPIEDFQHQLNVNITGTLIVTQAFAPLLGVDKTLKGKPGKIINIGSNSGKFAVPFCGAYVTAKHGLEGFTSSLRRELLRYNIDVVMVAPGAVDTAARAKANSVDMAPLAQTDYLKAVQNFKSYVLSDQRKTLTAEQVANTVLKVFNKNKPRSRYSPDRHKLIQQILPAILPPRWMDKILKKKLKIS